MPLDFPSNPAIGQTYTSSDGSTEWVFDGVKWTNGGGASNVWLPLSGGTMTGPLNVTATGSTTPRSVQDRLAETIDVRDYGATGDGATNDTAAFNAALSAASATNCKTVLVPSGLYKLDPINVPVGIVLRGDVFGPIDPQPGFLTNAFGATLYVNSYASPFITLNRSSGLQDVMIYDPGQVAPTASAPNVHPALILMSQPARVARVTLINAYVGIQVRSGRCIIKDCYIGAYSVCVDTDTSADVTYFDNIWCGPFYDTAVGLFPWQAMDNWVMNNNGVGFSFARADAVHMVNCGSLNKWAGLYMQDGTGSPSGPSYGKCVNQEIDGCVYGVVMTSGNAAGWNFSNLKALPATSAGWQGVAPFYLQTGGTSAPVATWAGGGIGPFPSSWTYPNGLVNAGRLKIRGVDQVPDTATTGVTDGSNAPAGMLGEFITASNTTGTTLTSTSPANVASISLTAGDWDVRGEVWALPSGSATSSQAAITPNSASLPNNPAPNASRTMLTAAITGPVSLTLGPVRMSLSASATAYLVAQVAFASGTCSAQGVISARRVR